MIALDLTADAEEYQAIASEWKAPRSPLVTRYAERGEIAVGLSAEVRYWLSWNEGLHARHITFKERAAAAFKLGKLLGHVGPLEDQLNPDRACEKSPTGWHEWANNQQCCHCGKEVP